MADIFLSYTQEEKARYFSVGFRVVVSPFFSDL
jgi:hypothetical protein